MKPRFRHKESFKHLMAKLVLSQWVNGIIEEPFYINGEYLFIPDVTVKEDGILTSIYEVVASHAFTGKKLGLIQEWCYRNSTDLTIFEISADYILAQTEKPDPIIPMDCYIIDLFEK